MGSRIRQPEQAIELDPDRAVAHCSRGQLLTFVMRMEAAVASFDRAINSQTHLCRGIAQSRRCTRRSTVRCCRRERSGDSQTFEPEFYLGRPPVYGDVYLRLA